MADKKNRWSLAWGIFMVAFYLVMGYLLIFTPLFDIGPVVRIVIGVLFALYGLFRGYRMWAQGA